MGRQVHDAVRGRFLEAPTCSWIIRMMVVVHRHLVRMNVVVSDGFQVYVRVVRPALGEVVVQHRSYERQ